MDKPISINTIKDLKEVIKKYPDNTEIWFFTRDIKGYQNRDLYVLETVTFADRYDEEPALKFGYYNEKSIITIEDL